MEDFLLENIKLNKKFIVIVSVMMFFLFVDVVLAKAPKTEKVAILPFEVNAKDDIAFIRDAIYDMLSSRLYLPNEVQIINRKNVELAYNKIVGPNNKNDNIINENIARQIGANLGADYVFYGTLTEFGSSFSIDAVMVDVNKKDLDWQFYHQAKGIDEVIPRVGNFVGKINKKVFGRAVVNEKEEIVNSNQDQNQIHEKYASPEKLIGGTGLNLERRKTPFWQFWGDDYEEGVEDIFEENQVSGEVSGDGQSLEIGEQTEEMNLKEEVLDTKDIETAKKKDKPFWKIW